MPAIDLRGGSCVRLLQGDFAAETRYGPSPEALLHHYRSLGALWLHVVDLDGARDGTGAHRALIAALAAPGSPRLQVGGGVRSAGAIRELLDLGVARVVIGSAALNRPGEVRRWLTRFGAERVCLAFDVRATGLGEARVHTHGWTQPSHTCLWEALGRYARSGLRHVLCTDITRDGTLSGPNLALYRSALARFPEFAWQASGGVRDARDLAALAALGMAAAVSGRALLEARIGIEELRPFLPDASSPASTYAPARS